MAARFVSTSRLNNIVQMISLSHQSGILRVVRGHGPTQEMGQIRFLDGEPVSALLGQLTGASALNVLMNWGECAYAFDESLMPELADNGYGSYGGDAYRGRSPQGPGSPTGSWPSYGYSSSLPSSSPPAPSPLPYEQQANTSYPGMGYGSNTGYGYGPGTSHPAGQPGTVPGADFYPAAAPATSTTTASSLPVMRPEMLRAIPYRMAISEQIDRLPLDRRERMVLLLIDGQRTVADLTRLTRRNEQELYAVLMHLNMLGLIQFRS
jgi:hypothetical protein